jgi:ketosteroid isomerase-like protein
MTNPDSDLRKREIITEFYDALRVSNTSTIANLLEEHFADDVVLTIPPSLSYGGTTYGREALKKMLGGMSHPKSPIDPATLTVTRLTATGDEVAAQVTFSWRIPSGDTISTSNVEWFTFRDGRVAEMNVFYFDTARWAGANHGLPA